MFSDFDTWADQVFWPSVVSNFGARSADSAPAPAEMKVEMEISTKSRALQLQQDVQQGTVTAAKVLTAPGEPQKRHLEIKLPEDMEYEAGDYLAILPLNPDDSVRRVLAKFSLPWDATVTIKSGGPVNLPDNKPVSAFDLLKGYVELSVPVTKKVRPLPISHLLRILASPATHSPNYRTSKPASPTQTPPPQPPPSPTSQAPPTTKKLSSPASASSTSSSVTPTSPSPSAPSSQCSHPCDPGTTPSRHPRCTTQPSAASPTA